MKKLVFVLVSFLLLTACVDLELEPIDTYGVNVLKDAKSANMVLNAAYSQLTDYQYYGRAIIFLNDITSDDSDYIDGQSVFAHRKELDNFNFTSGHVKFSLVYSSAYKSIAICNTLLDYWTEGSDPYAKGQALFLRSLNYFNLVRLFGDVPLLTTTDVPFEYYSTLNRIQLTVVYDQIIKDLTEIVDSKLLPEQWSDKDKGRADIWAANSLLAKVYLTIASEGTEYTGNKEGMWQKAANRAKYVIDYSGRALEPDYKTIWLPDNEYKNSEVIFALGANGVDKLQGGTPGRYFTSYLPIDPFFNGWGNNVPNLKLYNSFHAKDYRKEVGFLTRFVTNDTIERTSNITNQTKIFSPGDTVTYDYWIPTHIKRPHLRKFAYSPGPVNNFAANIDGINFMVLRYADVLLMFAEADNEANGPGVEARQAMNTLLRRAYKQNLNTESIYDLPASLTKASFRNIIREERRKELHHEAQRWFDLVRWNVLVAAMNDVGNTNVKDHHKYFPIPQIEIDNNPNLTQNVGY